MAGEIQIGGTTFATESGGTVTVANVDSATNRQNLGLEIGVDVQAFDADTTKNDVANTFTANQIISVTDNTNAALRVTQLGTGNALVVEDETNPDSTPFVVDASGNVGIGTSSPASALDVTGTVTADGLTVESGLGNTALLGVSTDSGTEILLADPVGGVSFKNVNGDIELRVDGSASTAASTRLAQKINENGDISFYEDTGTTAKFFWDASTERLGIGTTSPTSTLHVNGSLSKSSGSFKIDHPLPEKTDTHHLVHSFVEAPQADLIYRGKVQLVNGLATINIDTVAGMTEGTFVALNREVQCFTSNESDWDVVRGSVTGNILTIECQNAESTATISWLVIGERQDQHMYDTDWTDENGKVIVEPLKEIEALETTP